MQNLEDKLAQARELFEVPEPHYSGAFIFVLSLKGSNCIQKVGCATLSYSGGASAYLASIDVDENWRRKGGATLLAYHVLDFLRRQPGVEELRMSCEGSGTVQVFTLLVGQDNCIYAVGNTDIDYEQAVHIMDVEFGYTHLNVMLHPLARD